MWKEQVKDESNGAYPQPEEGGEDERPTAREPLPRHAAGVSPPVLHARREIRRAQRGGRQRILQAAQEQHRDHAR